MLLAKKRRQTEPPPFMGIYEAAEYCRVSYRLFREAVKAGKIPYVVFGKNTYRFAKESLDSYIRGGEQTATETRERR